MEYGTILVIAAVLLFYLRLILLQWGKARRVREEALLTRAVRKGKQGKSTPPEAQRTPALRFENVYLVVLAMILMVMGLVMNFSRGLSPEMRAFWWIPSVAGILLFGLSIR